jgi:hypothetical protein
VAFAGIASGTGNTAINLTFTEGMKVGKAKGHLRGKRPKLNHRQQSAPGGPVQRRRVQHR